LIKIILIELPSLLIGAILQFCDLYPEFWCAGFFQFFFVSDECLKSYNEFNSQSGCQDLFELFQIYIFLGIDEEELFTGPSDSLSGLDGIVSMSCSLIAFYDRIFECHYRNWLEGYLLKGIINPKSSLYPCLTNRSIIQ